MTSRQQATSQTTRREFLKSVARWAGAASLLAVAGWLGLRGRRGLCDGRESAEAIGLCEQCQVVSACPWRPTPRSRVEPKQREQARENRR